MRDPGVSFAPAIHILKVVFIIVLIRMYCTITLLHKLEEFLKEEEVLIIPISNKYMKVLIVKWIGGILIIVV